MNFYVEKSPREDGAVNVGVETPLGSGFASIPAGRRELLRYAGCAAVAGAGLILRIRRDRREKARRAARKGTFGRT